MAKEDITVSSNHVQIGDLSADSYDELKDLVRIHDSTRFLGHIQKVKLIKGDAVNTIPDFIWELDQLYFLRLA